MLLRTEGISLRRRGEGTRREDVVGGERGVGLTIAPDRGTNSESPLGLRPSLAPRGVGGDAVASRLAMMN